MIAAAQTVLAAQGCELARYALGPQGERVDGERAIHEQVAQPALPALTPGDVNVDLYALKPLSDWNATGALDWDQTIARELRRAGKPVVLCVNKTEKEANRILEDIGLEVAASAGAAWIGLWRKFAISRPGGIPACGLRTIA